MSENDINAQEGLPGRGDRPTPVLLSYATPIEIPSRKVGGISNPRSLITVYFVGVMMPIISLMTAQQLNDPIVSRQMHLGDYSPLANDLLIALMIAGVLTTLFAFALTRRVFPASRPPRKCPPRIAVLVGVGHPLLMFSVAEVSFRFGLDLVALRGIVLIVLFLAVPILSGIWIRSGPAR